MHSGDIFLFSISSSVSSDGLLKAWHIHTGRDEWPKERFHAWRKNHPLGLSMEREKELFRVFIVNFLQAMNAPKKVTMCGRGITPLGFLNALLLHIGPANRHKG